MSSPPFQPSPGRLLLRPIETEESIGRIALLDRTREKLTANQYTVVAVGDSLQCEDEDCERPHPHPFAAQAGDWVLIKHRSVVPTDVDPYLIAWQDDVMAVLRSEPR